MPSLVSGSQVYIKHGNDLFKYYITWDWNFNDNPIEGDITISPVFDEIKYTIGFNRGNPTNYTDSEGFAKENLPDTITGIRNNTTVTSAQANAYATDYTKNEFKYVLVPSDTQKHRFYKTGWVDQHNQPFIFGTTQVTENKVLKPVWEIQKWDLIMNYNGAFYNDISVPATTSIKVYDRFSLKTSPNYNPTEARNKFTVNKSISYAISNFPACSGTIRTYPVWYWDSGRSNAFSTDYIIEKNETIYAKWGTTSVFSWHRYAGGVWDDTAKNYSKHNSISESSFLCPSFANGITLTITSGGGNSIINYGIDADPVRTEKVETGLTKPGTNGGRASISGYPKRKFRYFIGGSQQASWLTDDIRPILNPAAGVAGGTETNDGNERFNLGDHGAIEKSFGSAPIGSALMSNWKNGQTIYTNWGSHRQTGNNQIRARFVGVCNTTRNGRKNDDSTVTVFLQVQGYMPELGWFELLSPSQVRLGTLYYYTWETGGENQHGSNEHTELSWSTDTDYYNSNPHRWSYNGPGGSGYGGFACYSTCKDGSSKKANSSAFCYGNGGGLYIQTASDNPGVFS
jgi:hypothetical protein